MAKSRRRDRVFAGIAVALAIAVGIALVIRLTDDDDGSPFDRVTPWAKLRALPEVGTLEYSCGFPGGLQATRLSVLADGATVSAGVRVSGSSIAARVMPGGHFATPYGTPGDFTWRIVRRLDRGKIEITVNARPPDVPSLRPSACRKPKLIVFMVRPTEQGQR